MAAAGKTPKVLTADGKLHVDQLQTVLSSAIEADARYQRENDAKFRAVAQKVPTYEDFEQMVKGAHIKPMTEDITQLNLKKSSWTSGRAQQRARHRILAKGASAAPAPAAAQGQPTEAPATVNNFLRDWRSRCASSVAKYAYLLLIGGERLEALFRVEIGHGLLGEMGIVLNECFESKDGEDICDIFCRLPNTNRFSLTVEFLSDAEAAAIAALHGKLVAAGLDVPAETAKAYGIKA
eukprot:m.86436 g.86436  ORF g.86436 m.86436 type:complete len:237 (-) comp8432_c0_seq4:80-790(-)